MVPVALCAIGIGLTWIAAPRLTRDSSLEQLFPQDSPTRQRFADFDAAFGTDDVLLVAVRDREGGVFSSSYVDYLDQITAAVEHAPGVERVVHLGTLLDVAVINPQLPPLPRPLLPRNRRAVQPAAAEDAVRASPLAAALLSPDGTASACWILLQPDLRSRQDYIERVRAVADRVPAPTHPTIEVAITGVPLLRGAALDLMWRDGLLLLIAALTVVAGVAVLGHVPWRIALGFILAWPAIIGILCTWGWLTGRTLHAFSNSTLPLLLITAGASFAHFGRALAGRAPRRATWVACALATFTTATGFATLLWSDLAPLAALGAEVAVGSATAFALCSWSMWSLAGPAVAPQRQPPAFRPPRWTVVAVIVATALAVPWFGLAPQRLARLGHALDYLPPDHPAARQAATAAASLGAPTALEVVVSADEQKLRDPEFLLQLEDFEAALLHHGGDDIAFILSPVTLLRRLDRLLVPRPTPGTGRITPATASYAIRHLIRPYLEHFRGREQPGAGAIGDFVDWMRQLLSTSGTRLRFGCRIPHLPPDRVIALVDSLETNVFARFRERLGAEIYATGYAVLLAEAAVEVRTTQARSLLLGGAVLALLLLLVSRRLLPWLCALLANGLTIGGMLSLMWLSGAQLNLYSGVLTASLLGVLVDDTIHLLWFIRRARASADSIDTALRHVAPSLMLSSLCLAAGFSVFAISALPDYRQFAWLAISGIGLALVWDLLVLPRWLRWAQYRSVFRRPGGGGA